MKIKCQKCNTEIYDLAYSPVNEDDYVTCYPCNNCGHKNLHDGNKFLNSFLEILFDKDEISGILKTEIATEYFKKVRKKNNLTQTKLAIKANVSLNSIKGLEAGYTKSVFHKCLNFLLLENSKS